MEIRHTILKEYRFDAAHRVQDSPTCGKLHGHSYIVQICLGSHVLTRGVIIDEIDLHTLAQPIFARLHGRYLIAHANMIQDDDPYWRLAVQRNEGVTIDVQQSTPDELARWFYKKLKDKLNVRHANILIVAVTVNQGDLAVTYNAL